MLVMNIIIVIVKISIRVRTRLMQFFWDFDPNLQHARSLAKYAYLGAPNMVKWGVPEKILQNVVQTRWS